MYLVSVVLLFGNYMCAAGGFWLSVAAVPYCDSAANCRNWPAVHFYYGGAKHVPPTNKGCHTLRATFINHTFDWHESGQCVATTCQHGNRLSDVGVHCQFLLIGRRQMEICDDCPDWGYVARTGKCFDCISGDLPLEIEDEIANAHQQAKECHASDILSPSRSDILKGYSRYSNRQL